MSGAKIGSPGGHLSKCIYFVFLWPHHHHLVSAAPLIIEVVLLQLRPVETQNSRRRILLMMLSQVCPRLFPYCMTRLYVERLISIDPL